MITVRCDGCMAVESVRYYVTEDGCKTSQVMLPPDMVGVVMYKLHGEHSYYHFHTTPKTESEKSCYRRWVEDINSNA